MSKDKEYPITATQLDEIATTIAESIGSCNDCKIEGFCDEKECYDCIPAWKQYIEQFVHDGKIKHKSLDEISDKVASSMKECTFCQIGRFCDENELCTTCNGTWFIWLLQKIKASKSGI